MGTAASILEVPEDADLEVIRTLAVKQYGPDKVAKAQSQLKDWRHKLAGGDGDGGAGDDDDDDDDDDDNDDDNDDDDDGAPSMSVDEAKQAADGLGKMFKLKATGGQTLTEHRALVFDCGAGETKAIFVQFKVVNGRNTISLQELDKAPAVLDFLNNKPVISADEKDDSDDYKARLAEVDKEGNDFFATEELREQAQQALRAGFWFLDKKPTSTTDDLDGRHGAAAVVLEPRHFVQFCLQTKHKLAARGALPDAVMIGIAAWTRDTELEDKSHQLIKDLTAEGLLCKKLLQTQEGTFEAAAVGYAYGEVLASAPDGQYPELSGVLGSGGSSVQFMHSMKYRACVAAQCMQPNPSMRIIAVKACVGGGGGVGVLVCGCGWPHVFVRALSA